ncbi:Dihydrofolate reductase [Ekhidna lutea]|uniref:Dihydrofolate reductase n=1 Tax=Ekhidna lutea TaxID=447679 RepID=A0A239HJW4_EKHLU|nr:dihydrofolate reductase family protein [Ekhidna lutea]SNS80554.1 Dihydrofolate reductase [Ekhidna lutea]
MRKIVYYVATSLDGYIAGENDDVSMFAVGGEGVEQYMYDLQSFDTVIMGRRTYEFGYRFGLEPGQPAYPHMDHFIYSSSLCFDNANDQVKVVPPDLNHLEALKKECGSEIYLCGGGNFAGWLMKNGLIDEVKLKVNPIILGGGIRLFGEHKVQTKLKMVYCQSYPDGMQIITFEVGHVLNN